MSYKTRRSKRAIRRRQKQARAANAQMDELFRKRAAWRRAQRRPRREGREAVHLRSRREGSREVVKMH